MVPFSMWRNLTFQINCVIFTFDVVLTSTVETSMVNSYAV